MFSFSFSCFSVSAERIETCAARNSMHGFEIPPFAAISALLSRDAELDWDEVRAYYSEGCRLVFKLTGSDELKTFFSEFILLAEEQCGRLCTELLKRKDLPMTDAELALPFLLADFYSFAADRFSSGRLEMLLDTEKSFADVLEFLSALDMPGVLKAFFADSFSAREKECLISLFGKDAEKNGMLQPEPEMLQDMHRLCTQLLGKVAAPV